MSIVDIEFEHEVEELGIVLQVEAEVRKGNGAHASSPDANPSELVSIEVYLKGASSRESLDYLKNVYIRDQAPPEKRFGFRVPTLKRLDLILAEMAIQQA